MSEVEATEGEENVPFPSSEQIDIGIETGLNIEGDGTGIEKSEHCFICWRMDSFRGGSRSLEALCQERLKKNNLFGAPASLKCELSVIFLLRKVLGIRTTVLSNILEGTGVNGGSTNPSNWNIKLCRPCHVLFREAQFIHQRLLKFQADFECLAKEIRELLVLSSDNVRTVAKVPVPTSTVRKVGRPRKKTGRPPGQKGQDRSNERGEINVGGTAVEILRNNFLDEYRNNNQTERLEASSLKVLYTTKGTASVLDNVHTTEPIKVKLIATAHSSCRNVPTISLARLPSLNGNGPRKRPREPVIFKMKASSNIASFVNPDGGEEEPENIAAVATVIKRELAGDFNEIENLPSPVDIDWDNTETFDDAALVGEEDEINQQFGSDVRCPTGSSLRGKSNLSDDGNGSNGADDKDDKDSDYDPEADTPTVKKKDKRFTRKKPNVKENLRKKKYRELKISSFEKFSIADINIEPVSVADSKAEYRCPQEGCELFYHRKFECHVHVLRDHYDDPMPYHCHICDLKRFSTEKYFRRHMNRFHHDAKNPYDDDYDPERHSAEKLKSVVAQDEVWKSYVKATEDDGEAPDSEHSSEDEKLEPGTPSFPDEVLEKFKSGKNAQFSCRMGKCKRKFRNEMLRDGHEKRIHQGIDKAFPCDKCPRAFYRRTRLLQHMAVVHFSNQYSCHHCGGRFADKILLAGHIGRAHLGDNTPFKCPLCPRKFARRTRMDEHAFKQHGTPLPSKAPKKKIPANAIPVPKLAPAKAKKILEGEEEGQSLKKCWLCHSDGKPMLFDTPEDMKEHNEQHYSSLKTNEGEVDERPFKCPTPNCSKEYRTHGALDFHIVNIHKGEIMEATTGELKCTHCDATFHRSYLLDMHMAKHGVSRYMCNFCAKQFRTQRYLEDHQRQFHYKEMKVDPFKCQYCGKVLNTNKSLNQHIATVHTKDTPFKCKVPGCSFGTMYISTLNSHFKIKHTDRKNAICPVCSKFFATQFYLSRHMYVHTGEKPYKCSTCGKQFSDMPTYNRHVEAHLGKVHKCPLEHCGKEYNTRHAFRVHLKQHQAKGIQVEIPKFRYQPAELDKELPTAGETKQKEEVTENYEEPSAVDEWNSSSELPILQPEEEAGSSLTLGHHDGNSELPPNLCDETASSQYRQENNSHLKVCSDDEEDNDGLVDPLS